MSAQTITPQLRPLGVGEILDVGIKIYLRNWLTLWKIVVLVVLPAEILANLVQVSMIPSDAVFQGRNIIVFNNSDLNAVRAGIVVAGVIGVIAALLAQAGCFRAVADAYLGERASAGASLRFAGRRLFALIVLAVVTVVLIVVGLFLCIVPGVYLAVAFYVAVPVLLVEGVGPFKALARSRRLVQGRWWPTLGVAVVGTLLVLVISYVIVLVLTGLVVANSAPNSVTGVILRTLVSTVASMLTTPAAAAFATVLYIDLRVRKEGFDLLLLARGIGSASAPAGDGQGSAPSAPVQPADAPSWQPPPGGQPDDS